MPHHSPFTYSLVDGFGLFPVLANTNKAVRKALAELFRWAALDVSWVKM